MNTKLIIIYTYVFVVGTCIASFVNVVIYRLPKHIKFIKGRSSCPNCQQVLKLYDMIPLVSWILLQGKCRECKSLISIYYPIVELNGGLLALWIFHCYMFTWNTLFVFALSMILLMIAIVDANTMEIPNCFIVSCLILAGISLFLYPKMPISSRFFGLIIVSIPMCYINFISHDSFGGGDIKLMAVCGFILGSSQILLAVLMGIIIAQIYVAYLIGSKKAVHKDHIAFGPYLCVGILISFMYGSRIIDAYSVLYGF